MYDILVVIIKKNWENFGRPDNRCLMRNVGDLHFGSRANAKKKKETNHKARKRVCGMGVVDFVQNALFTLAS